MDLANFLIQLLNGVQYGLLLFMLATPVFTTSTRRLHSVTFDGPQPMAPKAAPASRAAEQQIRRGWARRTGMWPLVYFGSPGLRNKLADRLSFGGARCRESSDPRRPPWGR